MLIGRQPGPPNAGLGRFYGYCQHRTRPEKPIQLVAVESKPFSKGLPAAYSTTKTELYKKHYLTTDVSSLTLGRQGKDLAVIAWIAPQGTYRVLSLTLGQNDDEWQESAFLKLLEKRCQRPN